MNVIPEIGRKLLATETSAPAFFSIGVTIACFFRQEIRRLVETYYTFEQ